MTQKGKVATWLGVVVSAIGAIAADPNVQAGIPSQYAPYVQLIGTVIAAAGPSLRAKKK